jgi:ABC-type bacteriocin/lantibiotic exporter with double-glycine peptidase domain
MLLHRYGIAASEGEMAYLANTSLFGTSEYGIAQALTAKMQDRTGFAAVEETDYEELVRIGQPFIAHVNPPGIGPHSIFVQRARPSYVVVIDPLDGFRKKLSRREFAEDWDGTIVRLVGAN